MANILAKEMIGLSFPPTIESKVAAIRMRNMHYLSDNKWRIRPTTLGEAFSLARIIEAHFEAIAEKEKEQIIKKKADTILSLQSELASLEVKGSLDADEDIGVYEVSSAITVVFPYCAWGISRKEPWGSERRKKSVVLRPRQQKAEEEKDGGCNSKKNIGSRNK
ncbi:hypothetical protein Tco_0489095 [Tanacetum coccineum]